MGRNRNPERNKSLERYLASDGKMGTKELAKAAGVKESQIRKWKSQDKWKEALEHKPKKRGAQKGNKNAAGKTPAKLGNRNAVTHGAYATVSIEDIGEDKVEAILQGADVAQRMAEELQALMVRRTYLEGLLEEYQSKDADGKYYNDKIVDMVVPASHRNAEGQGLPEGGMRTAMKTVVKSSAFDRRQKVEAELNRVHGRIIKQLDSMKSYEMEKRRIDIEERRLELANKKATGKFDVPEENAAVGETVIDDVDCEDV